MNSGRSRHVLEQRVLEVGSMERHQIPWATSASSLEINVKEFNKTLLHTPRYQRVELNALGRITLAVIERSN